jgi:hypothetical protein
MIEMCVLATTFHVKLHAVPAAAQTAEGDAPNAVAVPAPHVAGVTSPQTISVAMGAVPVNQHG